MGIHGTSCIVWYLFARAPCCRAARSFPSCAQHLSVLKPVLHQHAVLLPVVDQVPTLREERCRNGVASLLYPSNDFGQRRVRRSEENDQGETQVLADSLSPQPSKKIVRAHKLIVTVKGLLHAGERGLLSKWW